MKLEKVDENTNANSFGQHLKNSQITEPPYKLKRCDQVISVQGERFLSYYDYSKREETFYEIGVYVINMFLGNNTNMLLDSIELAHLTKIPKFIIGTKTCLDVFDKNSNKRFPICLKTEDIMYQIENIFNNFMSYRNGDDLQDPFIKMKIMCKKNK